MTDPTTHELTDVGPVTPPPNWCLPDVQPDWQKLAERFGGGLVCEWTREVSGGCG